MTVAYQPVPTTGLDTGASTKKGHHCKTCILVSVCLCLSILFIVMYTCTSTDYTGLCCLGKKKTVAQNVAKSLEQSEDKTDSAFKRRLPGAIIIGVRKGGTRAMIEYLSMHPDIVTARPEIHYFDREQNYAEGTDWYRNRMPYSNPSEMTVEKTPSYFTTPSVAERVFKLNPKLKLILLVRDPVERAISDYTQIHVKSLKNGNPHKRFKYLAIDQRNGRVRRQYVAIDRSIYSNHLTRWLRYFPREQIFIIRTRDLVQKPYETIRSTETFLGLQHKIVKNRFYFNATKGFYCMDRKDGHRCLSQSKGRVHVPVDRETKRTLKRFFKPFNQQFYRLVGRDFGWDAEN